MAKVSRNPGKTVLVKKEISPLDQAESVYRAWLVGSQYLNKEMVEDTSGRLMVAIDATRQDIFNLLVAYGKLAVILDKLNPTSKVHSLDLEDSTILKRLSIETMSTVMGKKENKTKQ